MNLLNLGNRVGQASGIIFGYLLFKLTGWVGLLFLAVIYLAIWLSDLYIKSHKSSEKIMRWLGWLNLIAWFIPVFGIFICISSFKLLPSSEANNLKKYKFLTIFGLILSIGNAVLGILMGLR